MLQKESRMSSKIAANENQDNTCQVEIETNSENSSSKGEDDYIEIIDVINVINDKPDDMRNPLTVDEEMILFDNGSSSKKKTPLKRRKKTLLESQEKQDLSDNDDFDTPEAIAEHLNNGCGCQSFCFDDLNPEDVYKHRLNIAELTKNEHDMYLMGLTMACLADSKTTANQKDRQRQRSFYVYKGKRVCLDAFLFLENVTMYHMKRIRSHALTNGIVPRTHGNFGKRAHNAFSFETYQIVENYIKKILKKYKNVKGVIYGIKRRDIYNSYKKHGRKPDGKLMGYSTFRHFMKKQFPKIRFHPDINSSNSERKKTQRTLPRTKNLTDKTKELDIEFIDVTEPCIESYSE